LPTFYNADKRLTKALFILGELALKACWLMVVTLQILAASGQPNDFSDFTILRHNYGVVMTKVNEAQIATDYWTYNG